MTRSALKITRSSERQELASAIGHAEKAAVEVGRITALVDAAETAAADVEDRLRAACAAVSDARAAQAATYEAAIEQGHPAPRDDSVRDALNEAFNAEEQASATTAALGSLKSKLDDAKDRHRQKREHVAWLAAAVVASETRAYFEKVVRMQAELGDHREILLFLRRSFNAADPDLAHEIGDFLAARVFPKQLHHRLEENPWPEVIPWRDAIAALQRDADAPLPETKV